MSKTEVIAWLDVETSGRDPNQDTLLEIAIILTNMRGESIAHPFHRLIQHTDLGTIIEESEDKIKTMHQRSGLWEDLWANGSNIPLKDLDGELQHFLHPFKESKIYIGGNSIFLDRDFVRMNAPESYKTFSHQSIDVTSLSIAISRNSNVQPFMHESQHRALSDVRDSIHEYQYHLLKFEQDGKI